MHISLDATTTRVNSYGWDSEIFVRPRVKINLQMV